MKKIIVGLLLSVVFLGGCSRTTIEGTEEGVVVKKPWFIGESGVQTEPKTTGTHFHWVSTSIYSASMIPFQMDENFEDLISSDRKPVDIDVYIQLKISDGKSPALYENFQNIKSAYKNNIAKPFRSAFRETAKGFTMWELVEDKTVMKKLEAAAMTSLENILEDKGIPLDALGVEISKANPPDEVKEEVARTAAQTQRAETEEARRQAEVVRKAAEEARANADKAYQSKMALTAEQYIELMKIEAEYKLIDVIAKKESPFTLLVGVDGVAVPTK